MEGRESRGSKRGREERDSSVTEEEARVLMHICVLSREGELEGIMGLPKALLERLLKEAQEP